MWKNSSNSKSLINSNNEINIKTSVYTLKLGFLVQKTTLKAQKIDISSLVTYKIVIMAFLIYDKHLFFFKKFLY